MSSHEDKDLHPDDHLIRYIFPQSHSPRTTVFAQNFDNCTFIAHLCGSSAEDVVSIAKLAIPDLVPAVERFGTTTTADGRNVDFSVTNFVVDTVTLESIWDDLENDQQGLLEHIVQNHSRLSLDATTGSITIHSELEDVTPVSIPSNDLQRLQDIVVLCHQDLEPRNNFVRPKKLQNDTTYYQIAAIVDWEMSGFFPFSYEYVYKDLFLGSSNLYFTYYTLFKEHGAPLIPMSSLPSFHRLFMEAIEFAHYSQVRGKRSMSALIAQKWVAKMGLERQQPAGTGWLKKGDAPNKQMSEAEIDELVQQVLAERRRK